MRSRAHQEKPRLEDSMVALKFPASRSPLTRMPTFLRRLHDHRSPARGHFPRPTGQPCALHYPHRLAKSLAHCEYQMSHRLQCSGHSGTTLPNSDSKWRTVEARYQIRNETLVRSSKSPRSQSHRYRTPPQYYQGIGSHWCLARDRRKPNFRTSSKGSRRHPAKGGAMRSYRP
jgi:hypothetical protein